jgi:hypothetical protein
MIWPNINAQLTVSLCETEFIGEVSSIELHTFFIEAAVTI